MLKKIGLKLLSILLSASMVASYCPCYAENKSASDSNTQKNSILKKVLIGAGAVGATGATIISIICIKDLIKNHNLKKQVEIFVNRAPDVFQVEEELIKQTDPDFLAASLRKLNSLFDKYKVFVDVLIEKLRRENEKFTLGCCNSVKPAKSNLYKIELNPVCYSKNKAWYTERHCSPADFDQRKVYNITHKFGHVIEKIIVHIIIANFKNKFDKLNAQCEEYHKIVDEEIEKAKQSDGVNNKMFNEAIAEATRFNNEAKKIINNLRQLKAVEDAAFGDFPRFIKAEIIKIAQKNYKCCDTEISECGRKNDGEWFAEVFAHLECNSQPNELGLAMRDYLMQQKDLVSE